MSENQKTGDNKFGTGASQTADADHLDFLSMPLIGLLGVARTTHEGGSKYGRFNYMRGIPVYVHLNHAVRHILMYSMGDRSEPHLSHAAWRCLAATQTAILNPELDLAHMPGPGYTLTPDMISHLDEQAPILAEKRKDKSWVGRLSDWVIGGLPEVLTLLGQRGEAAEKSAKSKEWARVVNETIRTYAQQREAEAMAKPSVGRLIAQEYRARREEQADEHRAKVGLPPLSNSRAAGAHTVAEMKSEIEREMAAEGCNQQRLDKNGKPIPQSLWIYLKDKVGVRYEEDERGQPKPGYGETWCEFDDGSRLYYLDVESKRVAKLFEPTGKALDSSDPYAKLVAARLTASTELSKKLEAASEEYRAQQGARPS